MKRSVPLIAGLLLLACGGEDAGGAAEPTSASPEEREEAAAPAESENAAPNEAPPEDDARADAIARAEAFVRAQGYTDSPPTVSGGDVVREGIEGSLEDRRGTLDPTALSAARAEDGTWMVIFRYADPDLAGRGRMLLMPPDDRPRFVHQDRLLPAEE